MKNKEIEKLLRNAYKRKRKTKPVSSYEDIDYNLVGRYIDNKTTPEDNQRIQEMLERNDNTSDFLKSLKPENIKRAAEFREIKSKPKFKWTIRFPQIFTPDFLRGAAIAAVIIILITGGIFVSTKSNISRKSDVAQSIIEQSKTRYEEATFRTASRGIIAHGFETLNGKTLPKKAKLYDNACALLIGIDDYSDQTGFSPLKYSVKDMRKVEKKLREFQFNHVAYLANNRATKQNILEKFNLMMKEAGTNGSLFIYYAGHSYKHPSKKDSGYIIPYDGSRHKNKLEDRNISIHELRVLAMKHEVKHVYMVSDSCFSGLLCMRSGPQYSCQENNLAQLKEKTSKKVVQMLAASNKDQQSLDGLFTDVFIDSLDKSKDKLFVTASEIDNRTCKNVRKIAREKYNTQQTPVHRKLYDNGGEYVFVRTNQISASFNKPELRKTENYFIKDMIPIYGNNRDCFPMFAADLDDNGDIDFIHCYDNILQRLNTSGDITHEVKFTNSIELIFVKDINEDGTKEIAVSETIDTNLYVRILDENLKILKSFVCSDGVINTITSKLDTTFIEYSGVRHAIVDNFDNNWSKEILFDIFTGYGAKKYVPPPRFLTLRDYDSGKELWKLPIATSLRSISLDFDWATGKKVILAGSFSTGNGLVLPDGSDDLHSYIWLISADGKFLWKKTMGDFFTECIPQFVDMNRDGENEILACMSSLYDFRTNDVGNVYLFSKNGEMISCYTNELSVRSYCILPNYNDMEDNIIIGKRTGRLTLLDARLKEITNIIYKSKSGYPIELRIKNKVMNTRYGEFVLVYSFEREPINPSLGRITGHENEVCHYNSHIKLLDKKSLETKYIIPVSDGGKFPIETNIQLYDVDDDGQDEILVIEKENVSVYKIIVGEDK